MQHMSKEWVKVWHDPVLQGLELHHATYITHTFSRHMHDFYLITHYAELRPLAQRLGQERQAVKQVRHYLDEHYVQGVTLSELAHLVGLSPFYLLRVFEQEVGIPPHAYLESVRIRRAQRLLACGIPIAQVAYDLGFSTQSHLTHRFKRLLGVTPGQYVSSAQETVRQRRRF